MLDMLNFIGSGGAFHPERGNNSAFFELGTELFIFDVGGDVFDKLLKFGILEKKTRIHIFITHLHCDHVGGLGVLISYLYYAIFPAEPSRICLYFPSKAIIELLSLQGVSPSWYTYYPNRWDEMEVDGLEKPFEYCFENTPHVDELNYKGENTCFSIQLHAPHHFCLYYSGDTNQFADCLNQIQNYDYIYHEVTGHEEASCHFSYKKLLDATKHFSAADKQKIHLMHLDTDFNIEQAKKDGFQVVENYIPLLSAQKK